MADPLARLDRRLHLRKAWGRDLKHVAHEAGYGENSSGYPHFARGYKAAQETAERTGMSNEEAMAASQKALSQRITDKHDPRGMMTHVLVGRAAGYSEYAKADKQPVYPESWVPKPYARDAAAAAEAHGYKEGSPERLRYAAVTGEARGTHTDSAYARDIASRMKGDPAGSQALRDHADEVEGRYGAQKIAQQLRLVPGSPSHRGFINGYESARLNADAAGMTSEQARSMVRPPSSHDGQSEHARYQGMGRSRGYADHASSR